MENKKRKNKKRICDRKYFERGGCGVPLKLVFKYELGDVWECPKCGYGYCEPQDRDWD